MNTYKPSIDKRKIHRLSLDLTFPPLRRRGLDDPLPQAPCILDVFEQGITDAGLVLWDVREGRALHTLKSLRLEVAGLGNWKRYYFSLSPQTCVVLLSRQIEGLWAARLTQARECSGAAVLGAN